MSWSGMDASLGIDRGAPWRGGTHINLRGMTMAQQAKKVRPLQLENPSMDSEKGEVFYQTIQRLSSVGGSDFLRLQVHSLCCEIQGIIFIPITIGTTVDRPSTVNFRHVAGRFWAALPGQVLKIIDRSKYQ